MNYKMTFTELKAQYPKQFELTQEEIFLRDLEKFLIQNQEHPVFSCDLEYLGKIMFYGEFVINMYDYNKYDQFKSDLHKLIQTFNNTYDKIVKYKFREVDDSLFKLYFFTPQTETLINNSNEKLYILRTSSIIEIEDKNIIFANKKDFEDIKNVLGYHADFESEIKKEKMFFQYSPKQRKFLEVDSKHIQSSENIIDLSKMVEYIKEQQSKIKENSFEELVKKSEKF